MKDDAIPSPLSLQVLLPATKEALASLYATKQRTLLALLGIVIGISSVIAMITVGKIVEAEALKQFQELGTDFVTVEKSFGAPSPRGGAMSRRGLPVSVALRMAIDLPDVSLSAPMVTGSGKMVFGSQNWDANLVGAMQDFAAVNRLTVSAGRFISDLDQHTYFCVIGEEAAQKMAAAGTSSPVGARIKINGLLFTVIGVLPKMPEGGMRPFDPNRSVVIPLSTALRIIDHASVDRVLVRLHPAANPREAPARLTGYFKQRADFEVSVRTAEELIAQMEKQMRIFTLMLGAIGSISLIVGGVGVMNVMLVSVTERKNEIGVRRAFGAQRTDIQMQFLVEALVLCALGGIFGAAGGAGAAYIISQYSNWTFFMPKIALFLGVVVSGAIGLFFGFYPAFQASRLKIIQALRNE